MPERVRLTTMGRPTKYRPEYNQQVEELCLLGATDEALARFFKVGVSAITAWKREYPEFFVALRHDKTRADIKVAKSLFARATGYEYTAMEPFKLKRSTTTTDKDGSVTVVEEEFVKLIPIKKTLPPDVTACIFWLKNRFKEVWRDVYKIEDEQPIQEVFRSSEEVLAEMRKRGINVVEGSFKKMKQLNGSKAEGNGSGGSTE